MIKQFLSGLFFAGLLFGQTGTATYTAPSITPASISVAAGSCTAGSPTSTGVCCTAVGVASALPAPQVQLSCQIGGISAAYTIPVAASSPYSFKQTFGVNEVDMTFTVTNGVISATGTSLVSGTAGKTASGPF